MSTHPFTNSLINETSPYLLQHAHNPVNWFPWKDEILDKAKSEEKLIIISVGYAACHWCHVMEHESFEDETVGDVMNENYISIKVDREERPDVDQAYMNAVQLMTGSGGWPMNIIALPDGRPVWGGTYFKKEQWMSVLKQISDLYKKEAKQLFEYADKLEKGLHQLQIIPPPQEEQNLKKEDFTAVLNTFKRNFDHRDGGMSQVPKFVIPSNFQFLLRYAFQNEDQGLKDFVFKSLDKISYGGIFDHIEGGFSRYSVDERWHIPHFEKMLYDNAQMVSLYSEAYKATKNKWYKEVVLQTLGFIKNELTSPEGGFYSSLDADSLNGEGKLIEGAYYSWTKTELKQVLQDDFELFSMYYNINPTGKWEKDLYVPIRTLSNKQLCKEQNLTLEELEIKKKGWIDILRERRTFRSKPRLDNKQLISWNALMISGYVSAYKAFSIAEHLKIAKTNASFILENLQKKDGGLYHSYKDGASNINGFLEDYAFTIEAFIHIYEVTLEVTWLDKASQLSEYCIAKFYSEERSIFYFTSIDDRALITRNVDVNDNVMPAANSVMAKNLHQLSKYFDNSSYFNIAKKMLLNMNHQLEEYPQGYSNWLDLKMDLTYNFYEVVITGKKALSNLKELNTHYLANILIDGTLKDNSDRPLLKDRYKSNEELFYVCENSACKLPVRSMKECLEHFNKN